MTEHKLSEQELQEIREEAEKLYPVCMMGTPDKAKLHGITHYDFNEDQRQAYIAALTRERERVKGLVSALEDIIGNYDHDEDAHRYNNLPACRVCSARKAINAYNQNKEV